VGARGGWGDVLNGFDLSFVCLFTIGGVVVLWRSLVLGDKCG